MQAVQAAGFSRLYAVYKNYPAHPMCSHRARLVLDVPEQCCGVCLSTLTDRGSASCSRVLTVAGTVLDRGRNTRARPTSISRPPYGAQEFLVATAGAHAIRCRTPAAPTLWTAPPWVRRKIKEGRKGWKTSETLRKLSAGWRSHPQGAAPPAIGKTLAEIAEIGGMGRPAAVPNRGYRSAVTNVPVSSVFSSNVFNGLASPRRSSSGPEPGVIALSHLRNRTVTCAS
jgi:hypothetical protein